MTPLDQSLRNISELPLVDQRRQQLWTELEQAYASSPPLPFVESFRVWVQAIANKNGSADNIVYRLNSIARAFHVTPAILVDFFGSQAFLTRNSLQYLKALHTQRPATTFLELLVVFERKRRLGEPVSPAKALKQVVQSLHPNAVSTRQSRKRTRSAPPPDDMPVDEANPAASKPSDSETLDKADGLRRISPKLANSKAPVGRLNSTQSSPAAAWPEDQERLHQNSTNVSSSPGRVFDTSALGAYGDTITSGLDLTNFDTFVGNVSTSTPPPKTKSQDTVIAVNRSAYSTVAPNQTNQATMADSSKRATLSNDADAATALKRRRRLSDANGFSETPNPPHMRVAQAPPRLRITLDAVAQSWSRIDKDWLDDRIVNLAISRLATASVGTVDSLVLGGYPATSTLERLAPLRNKDTLLMPFYTANHWTLFRFVRRTGTLEE
ncbi:hypothetical protein LZ30DRAFT_754708 [Colletotrichum cereale]|nr:hypothetical protein LZ30DRAFT_754708 [Colletotrichum cereale]